MTSTMMAAGNFVVRSTDRYQARFRYSFRIDGLGNISGIGNGSYQTATWHLSGTNGSHGPFDCDVPMTTTEFAVCITGQADDGEMNVRFALEDAREMNEETFCGASFYGFASDDTRLARSLELVQPPDGLVLDQANPAIAPITKTVPEGDAGRRAAICTIEGTARDERLRGTPGSDVICAYGGRDRIDGGGGQDLIYAVQATT